MGWLPAPLSGHQVGGHRGLDQYRQGSRGGSSQTVEDDRRPGLGRSDGYPGQDRELGTPDCGQNDGGIPAQAGVHISHPSQSGRDELGFALEHG
jgi:hypothetical protein